MKKLFIFIFTLAALILSASGAMALENVDYSLEDGVLTIIKAAPEFSGELILPDESMGEVDRVVVNWRAFYRCDGITGLQITAKDEIELECEAFYFCKNLSSATLTAGDNITVGGDSSFMRKRSGAFEYSGLRELSLSAEEIVIEGHGISCEELEKAELLCKSVIIEDDGFAVCGKLTDFVCTAETSEIGEGAFYLHKDDRRQFQPWQAAQKGFVYVGDTLVAYTGDSEEVIVPTSKLTVDSLFPNKGIKSIVLPDEMEELPMGFLYGMFREMENLVSIHLPENLKTIVFLDDLPKLESINMPEGLEFLAGFIGCPSLTELKVPRRAEVKLAFQDCPNLHLTVYENSPAHEYVKSGKCDVPYDVIPMIRFADQRIRLAAQLICGTDGELYAEDLAGLKSLSVTGAATLEDLRNFPDLEELSATYGTVSDLTPLSDMTKLKSLNLSHNRIRDVSPLAGLEKLDKLDLSVNMIADFGPADGLAQRYNYTYNYGGYDSIMRLWQDEVILDLPYCGGGQWYYGVYRDGQLISGGRLYPAGYSWETRRETFKVEFEAGDSLPVVKVFCWDENLSPYKLYGSWTFPVISSEFLP